MANSSRNPAGKKSPPPPPLTESKNGTRGVQVIDAQLNVWTIKNTNQLFKGNVDTTGRGTQYLYWNHEVWALGTDKNWWRFHAGWTYGGADPSIPAPTPAPTPTPTIPPVESANGTNDVKVVDAQLNVWTIDRNNNHLLRNGIDTGGIGSTYLYWTKEVYTLGADSNWYAFRAEKWVLVGATDPEQPAPIPTPTPDPVPTPNPLVESAEGTHAVRIVDAQGNVWTIGADSHLLKGATDTGGIGIIYVYKAHEVYTQGTDQRFYVYRNGAWQFFSNGDDPTIAPVNPNYATKTCVNLANFGAFGGVDPFINRLKRSSRWFHSGGQLTPLSEQVDKKDGWLRGIPDGGQISNLITVPDIEGETDLTEQRAGTHHMLWKSELTLAVGGVGCDVGSEISKGDYAFNVPATVPVDGVLTLANPALNFELKNNSGAVQDFVPITVNGVQYPALVHEEDMADFLAGKHYQRSFINGLSSADYIRTMDWNDCVMQGKDAYGVESVPAIQPEHYMTEQHRTYVGPDNHSLFFPPEEIGYLAKEANVGVFNTVASKTTDAAHDYWMQKFLEGAGPAWAGTMLTEMGDENWNSAWPWNIGGTYLLEKIAPNIKVVDVNGNPSTAPNDMLGCACASRALALWRITEKYIPRERHKRVLGAQFAWPDSLGGMVAYVDPVTGMKMADIADQYAGAPYWGCDLGDITITQILDQRLWVTQPMQWWIDRCTGLIDKMVGAIITNQKFLAKYAPKLQMTCYEGGGWITEQRIPHNWEPRYAEGKEFSNFLRNFMEGEPGAIVTQYYWDKFIKGNFLLYNQFFHQGYTLGVQSGLHLSQHRKDIPRQALFRTFGK